VCVKSLLVIILQFFLQDLQFFLLHVLLGNFLQVDAVLIVEPFAYLFFSVGAIIVRVFFLVIIAVIVGKWLSCYFGDRSFLLLLFLILLGF
jgi:hypothetical protein